MKAAEMYKVEGYGVVVTGGASGIGLGFTEVLAENGARVTMLDISQERLDHEVKRLTGKGWEVRGMRVDVTDHAALNRAFDETVKLYGGLDVCFANAGIDPGIGFVTVDRKQRVPEGAIENYDDARWNRVIDINLNGVFATIKAAARHMKPRQSGRIVVTTSMAAFEIEAGIGAAYMAAKAGAAHLMRNAALELAKYQITVNAIAPGWFITNIGAGWMHQERSAGRGRAVGAAAPLRLDRGNEGPGAVPRLARLVLYHRRADRDRRRQQSRQCAGLVFQGESMIVVHHLNNSRSQRVLWLLEELGLDYEIKFYQREPSMRAPAALRAVHPLGKSPVITDGENTIAETGAIVEYLVDGYGKGRLIPPPDTKARLRYTYWLHYAEGSLMPPLLMSLIASRIAGPQVPWLARPIAKRIAATLRDTFIDPSIKLHLDFIESELTGRAYFCGDEFTAADVQMSFPLEAASMRAGLDPSRPKTWDWLQRIHARAPYQRALEKGGKYELLR